MASVKVERISIKELIRKERNSKGLVLLGAGDSLQDWLDSIQNILIKENHVAVKDKPNLFWQQAYKLITPKGRIDLVIIFNKEDTINLYSLSLWRLKFGECCWLNDYLTNENYFTGRKF